MSYLSEAHSLPVPTSAAPPPPLEDRRGLSLFAQLLCWLALGAACPAVLLCAYLVDRGATRRHEDLRRSAALLRELIPPSAEGCPGVLQQPADQAARLRTLQAALGYDLALYDGDRLLASTFVPHASGPKESGLAAVREGLPKGPFAPALRGEVLLRALESSEPVLSPLTHQGRRYLSSLVALGSGGACGRLVLMLAARSPRLAPGLPLTPFALGAVLLLLPLLIRKPFQLARHLRTLRRQALSLAQRSEGPGYESAPDAVLRRGDELGELGRAIVHLGEVMRESEARLGARLRELTTLHAIGQAISSVLDLEEALRKIIGETVAVFAARRGALVQLGPDGRCTLGASVRIDPKAADAVAALGEVLMRRGGRVRVDDLAQDPELQAAARHGGLSGPLLAAPLDLQGRLLGVLFITRSRGRQRFTETDLQLLATVADQAAVAIANARLYQEVQRSSADLEVRVEERTLDLVLANQELARTLSDLHRAQAQLLLSDRLASLGQLVAGVAHELNSPAAAIKGAADSLRDNVARMEERSRLLSELPLPPEQRQRFLLLCDEIAPAVHAGPLLSPALLRRRARALAAALGQRAQLTPSRAETLNALADLGRTLAELGIPEGPLQDQVLDGLSQCLRGLPADSASGDDEVRALSSLRLLLEYLEQRVYLYRNAHAIRAAIGQISNIVGALKRYSHLDQGRLEQTDVHEGLETTLVILHSELKYGILLTRKYGTVPSIHAYVDELNQVWTNLLHNAVQALRAQPGAEERSKEIVIETGARGGDVWVAIEDNGPGIPAELQGRIFEPFFTTKVKGEGTGIGLGIAQQIIHKHGGCITVESEPGRTRFTVSLPIRGPGEAERPAGPGG